MYLLRFIFFLIIIGLPFSIEAQFVIEEETLITFNSDVSSQEETNIFNSDINGDATILFNADASQGLYTQASTSIDNISINTQTSFTFYTSVVIKGDLKVFSQYLNVLAPVGVNGQFVQAKHLYIIGERLLRTKKLHQPMPLPNQQHTQLPSIAQHPSFSEYMTQAVFNYRKDLYFYKEMSLFQIAIPILKPPPQIS